jgi:hypothetical protein
VRRRREISLISRLLGPAALALDDLDAGKRDCGLVSTTSAVARAEPIGGGCGRRGRRRRSPASSSTAAPERTPCARIDGSVEALLGGVVR